MNINVVSLQLIYWKYNFVSKKLLSSSVISGLLYKFFLCPSKQPIHFFRSLLGRRKNGRGGGGGEREFPSPFISCYAGYFFYFFSRKGGPGADPGFFLGGGALVSCFTSTPISHIVFFLAEYQLY